MRRSPSIRRGSGVVRERIVFRKHAVQQMHLRRVTVEQVRLVLETGTAIETYTDRWPFPARLVLGVVAGRALHVLVADDAQRNEKIIVAVYDPSEDDAGRWDASFSRRLR